MPRIERSGVALACGVPIQRTSSGAIFFGNAIIALMARARISSRSLVMPIFCCVCVCCEWIGAGALESDGGDGVE